MYKLIAIDLDGTLLNSYGEISEENKKAIKKAREKGIEVVLASGRMASSIKSFANEIGANNYVIAGNGALVIDVQNNEILYNDCISKEKTLKIIKICEENNIYYTVNTEKYIISKRIKNNLLYYHYENAKRSDNQKTQINIVENISKYIEENDVGYIAKITISDSDKIIFNGIMKKIREIKKLNVLDVSNMSRKIIKSGTEKIEIKYFYTEITNDKVDKWNAIAKLAKKLGIDKSEIMAIGDNQNDLEMIKNAGKGIIIGNGALANQNIEGTIVESCDKNGVAEAINKYAF